jgi:uncharacterized peroxidase-related enzyme
MAAWAELQKVIRSELDDRSFGLITLAAALAMGSSYCALAHAKKLSRRHFSTAELTNIVRDPQSSNLPAPDKAMMALAAKVAGDSSAVSQADIDAVRSAGFSDAQIFDIVAAAAARCFFARVPDALGARPDAALAGLDPGLRTLLTVGRPIEENRKNHAPSHAELHTGEAF